MVQYVFTPWRDRRELLTVRRQFYPERHGDRPTTTTTNGGEAGAEGGGSREEAAAAALLDQQRQQLRQQQRHAVARVSVWMQRGNCPHLVESTALLRAAILGDLDATSTVEQGRGGTARPSGSYVARAAYAAAFSRFVTGLLDSNQDRLHKMSMYAVAKSVGLPAAFVELRHQATHEQLPSLTRLRAAARSALDWIWDYYWRHLASEGEGEGRSGGEAATRGSNALGDASFNACRKAVVECLAAEDVEAGGSPRAELLARYGEDEVLAAATKVSEECRDPKMLRKALSLTREILHASGGGPASAQEDTEGTKVSRDLDAVRLELAKHREELEEVAQNIAPDTRTTDTARLPTGDNDGRPGWSRYGEDWTPKPIGIV